MTTAEASARGRRSRNKGARFERDVARAIQPWFPDAKRSRDNGHRSGPSASPDSGDLAETGPELFWSLKDDQNGDTDAAWSLGAWFTECQQKAAALYRTGLLVQKRRGYSDPLDSWCWLTLGDAVGLATGVLPLPAGREQIAATPIRMTLRDMLTLLAVAEVALAQPPAVA